jgi:hypothetical protein
LTETSTKQKNEEKEEGEDVGGREMNLLAVLYFK